MSLKIINRRRRIRISFREISIHRFLSLSIAYGHRLTVEIICLIRLNVFYLPEPHTDIDTYIEFKRIRWLNILMPNAVAGKQTKKCKLNFRSNREDIFTWKCLWLWRLALFDGIIRRCRHCRDKEKSIKFRFGGERWTPQYMAYALHEWWMPRLFPTIVVLQHKWPRPPLHKIRGKCVQTTRRWEEEGEEDNAEENETQTWK